ncbi:MarR family transcriptional regulator [Desulfotomaculum defluvii]
MNKREKILQFDMLVHELVQNNGCQLKDLLKDLITPTQYFLLKLMALQNTCKAADIAHVLDISPSAATTILDRLYKNGWIEKNRSEKDRRIVWLTLTDNGRKILSEIEVKRIQLLVKQFESLREDELDTVCEIFKKLLKKE